MQSSRKEHASTLPKGSPVDGPGWNRVKSQHAYFFFARLSSSLSTPTLKRYSSSLSRATCLLVLNTGSDGEEDARHVGCSWPDSTPPRAKNGLSDDKSQRPYPSTGPTNPVIIMVQLAVISLIGFVTPNAKRE
jgi:hypothetical protein